MTIPQTTLSYHLLDLAQLISPIPEAHLQGLLDELEKRFTGYPFADEADPLALVEELEQQIRARIDGGGGPSYADALCCLRGFDAFSYRAYRIEAERPLFWNPLEQSYREFATHAATPLVHYQADREYPAPDMVYKWGFYFLSRLISNS